ncbi:MAG: ankyrin repeat domain-containing protein [Bacteroidota bacterium]
MIYRYYISLWVVIALSCLNACTGVTKYGCDGEAGDLQKLFGGLSENARDERTALDGRSFSMWKYGTIDGAIKAFQEKREELHKAINDILGNDDSKAPIDLEATCNDHKKRLLIQAINCSDLIIVEKLLNAGAKLNDEDPILADALQRYATFEHILKEKNKYDNGSALAKAALRLQQDATGIVKLLIAKGANINTPAPDRDKRTPLMNAALLDNEEFFNYILRQVKDVNTKDHKGRTALYYALRDDKLERLQALRAKGAEVYFRYKEINDYYYTPLIIVSTFRIASIFEKGSISHITPCQEFLLDAYKTDQTVQKNVKALLALAEEKDLSIDDLKAAIREKIPTFMYILEKSYSDMFSDTHLWLAKKNPELVQENHKEVIKRLLIAMVPTPEKKRGNHLQNMVGRLLEEGKLGKDKASLLQNAYEEAFGVKLT